ncbi:uncharacterized protein CEXT_311071 [Caerostris extrusa]|uniref:Uncharacterized protein n=1 Tax=Caerostris extrusa TaxID=172846 RepID=A0AAV4RAB8_CAEEX|nr:uncharacterized protein CEXT_311071 [Caerostris extrusa]
MALNPKNREAEEAGASKTLPRLRRSGCAATSYFESPLSSIISRSSVLNRSATTRPLDQNPQAEPGKLHSMLDNLRDRSPKGKKVSSIDIADVKATAFDNPRRPPSPQRADFSPPVVRSKILSSTLPASHKVTGESPPVSSGQPLSDSGYEEFKALHSKLMNPEARNPRSLKTSRQLSSSLTTLSTDDSEKKCHPSKRYSAMLTYEGNKGTLSGGSSPSRSPVQSRWHPKQFSSLDPTSKSSMSFEPQGSISEPEESETLKSNSIDRGRQNLFLQNYLSGCQKDNKKTSFSDRENVMNTKSAHKIESVEKSDNSSAPNKIISISDAIKSKDRLSSSSKDDSDEEILKAKCARKNFQYQNIMPQPKVIGDGYKTGRISPIKSESVAETDFTTDLAMKDEADNFRSRSFTEPRSKNKSAFASQCRKISSSSDTVPPLTPKKPQLSRAKY